MFDPNSPILDFYPTEFEQDLNGKKQDWEAVVKIPFIDEHRLLKAMRCALPPYFDYVFSLTHSQRGRLSSGKKRGDAIVLGQAPNSLINRTSRLCTHRLCPVSSRHSTDVIARWSHSTFLRSMVSTSSKGCAMASFSVQMHWPVSRRSRRSHILRHWALMVSMSMAPKAGTSRCSFTLTTPTRTARLRTSRKR